MNTYLYTYFNICYFYKKIPKNTLINKFQLKFFDKYSVNNKIKHLVVYNLLGYLYNNKIIRFGKILQNIFKLNKNIVIVDYNHNYNYLPIKNRDLFSRSVKNYKKYLSYFDVSIIIFFNLNNKKFIFKKLQSYKTINIFVGGGNSSNKFDFSLGFQNNKITHYLIYIFIVNIYLDVKNNTLNKGGSTLYIF